MDWGLGGFELKGSGSDSLLSGWPAACARSDSGGVPRRDGRDIRLMLFIDTAD